MGLFWLKCWKKKRRTFVLNEWRMRAIRSVSGNYKKMKIYNVAVCSNSSFKLTFSSENIQIYCEQYIENTKETAYLFIAYIEIQTWIELRNRSSLFFFLKKKERRSKKKERNLPIKPQEKGGEKKFAWFERVCVHRDCFCRSRKRFDPGAFKSTSDNNTNREESTDTSRLEHPKIVCSTCNVRPYDVSRAGWKFFPSLVGISFATYATGISRGGGGEGEGEEASPRAFFFFANSKEIPWQHNRWKRRKIFEGGIDPDNETGGIFLQCLSSFLELIRCYFL